MKKKGEYNAIHEVDESAVFGDFFHRIPPPFSEGSRIKEWEGNEKRKRDKEVLRASYPALIGAKDLLKDTAEKNDVSRGMKRHTDWKK